MLFDELGYFPDVMRRLFIYPCGSQDYYHEKAGVPEINCIYNGPPLLESHLKILPDRGIFISLWLFTLKSMTRQESLERMKKGFGRNFPVKLTEKDYETIYDTLHDDTLIEAKGEMFTLTERGTEKLKLLAEEQTAYLAWLHRKKEPGAQKIH